MIEIFHVSDLHFGKRFVTDCLAESLLKAINREYPFAESDDRYLLVTGDITDAGDEDQYALAIEVLKPFAGKIILTPGNHDYGGARGTAYDALKARYFDNPFAAALGFHWPFFDKRVFDCPLSDKLGNTLMMIGLSSCTKGGTWDDWARGEIGARQRKELSDKLAEYDANIPKILFLHHIPNKDADWKYFMTLMDWRELMAVVKKGNVDVLAFGHQGQLEVASERTFYRRALGRPMQVREFGKGLRRDRRARPITVLDANDSVMEQKCYRITLDGKQLKAELIEDLYDKDFLGAVAISKYYRSIKKIKRK